MNERTTHPIRWHKFAQGTTGLAKALTGIGHVSNDTAAQRLSHCAGCSALMRHRQNSPESIIQGIGMFDRCSACGCFVRAKTLLVDQTCPLGKW